MYFQALDDKKHCVGIYYDGKLIFDEQQFPKNLANMKDAQRALNHNW